VTKINYSKRNLGTPNLKNKNSKRNLIENIVTVIIQKPESETQVLQWLKISNKLSS
jgi:hypothetical protein